MGRHPIGNWLQLPLRIRAIPAATRLDAVRGAPRAVAYAAVRFRFARAIDFAMASRIA